MNYNLNPYWGEVKPTKTQEELILFDLVKKFEEKICPKDSNWRQINDSPKIQPKDKLNLLLKFIRVTKIQSFVYLVRNDSSVVAEKLRIMESAFTILKEFPEIKISKQDKLCFIR